MTATVPMVVNCAGVVDVVLLAFPAWLVEACCEELETSTRRKPIKMKAELEADLLVEGVTNGTGKNDGLIGALSCTTKDGTLKVNVGSGLTDEDRKKDPDEFIGKIVSVKYNEKIKDKNSPNWSLFLPIFQELRLDKSEADNL